MLLDMSVNQATLALILFSATFFVWLFRISRSIWIHIARFPYFQKLLIRITTKIMDDLKVNKEMFNAIADEIHSDKSPVGIDAKKTQSDWSGLSLNWISKVNG